MGNQAGLEKVLALCRRRGIVFPSSEIYGGLEGCWDYGPVGVEFKNNLKQVWWRTVVQLRDDVVGFDGSVLMAPALWQAATQSGEFNERMVLCGICRRRFRVDDLTAAGTCPIDGGAVGEVREFSMVLTTRFSRDEHPSSAVLRPDMTHALFTNFARIQRSSNRRLPFGIAQIGRAFRNECTPGAFGARQREFEQMECVYFVQPDGAEAVYQRWLDDRLHWYEAVGFRRGVVRLRENAPDELVARASAATDLEFEFPWGWQALERIVFRGDHDLELHMQATGKDLAYMDDRRGVRIIPHALTSVVSVDRLVLALLLAGYHEEPDKEGLRTVFRVRPSLAPTKVAVLPLSRREELCSPARELAARFRRLLAASYDETASIGKRYRRQDEIGTPICVTIDFATLKDDAVTVRDRDTMCQERVPIHMVVEHVRSVLALDDPGERE